MLHYCSSKKVEQHYPFVCVHGDKVISITVQSYENCTLEYEEDPINMKID